LTSGGREVHSTVVVVGAGQAGAQAVETLRREGHIGRIVLVGDEYARTIVGDKPLSAVVGGCTCSTQRIRHWPGRERN
jgi:cation diffusion facilitator CzcD-associated flavoprotein CzcO